MKRESAQWWLRANKHDLAAVTGTDAKALDAVDFALELYAYTASEAVTWRAQRPTTGSAAGSRADE